MFVGNYTVGIYVFKVNNGNARAMYEICLKLTVQTPERLQSRRSAVFVINVRHILHTVLFLLGTRNTTTWSNTCCRSTLTILGYMNIVFMSLILTLNKYFHKRSINVLIMLKVSNNDTRLTHSGYLSSVFTGFGVFFVDFSDIFKNLSNISKESFLHKQ